MSKNVYFYKFRLEKGLPLLHFCYFIIWRNGYRPKTGLNRSLELPNAPVEARLIPGRSVVHSATYLK